MSNLGRVRSTQASLFGKRAWRLGNQSSRFQSWSLCYKVSDLTSINISQLQPTKSPRKLPSNLSLFQSLMNPMKRKCLSKSKSNRKKMTMSSFTTTKTRKSTRFLTPNRNSGKLNKKGQPMLKSKSWRASSSNASCVLYLQERKKKPKKNPYQKRSWNGKSKSASSVKGRSKTKKRNGLKLKTILSFTLKGYRWMWPKMR